MPNTFQAEICAREEMIKALNIVHHVESVLSFADDKLVKEIHDLISAWIMGSLERGKKSDAS